MIQRFYCLLIVLAIFSSCENEVTHIHRDKTFGEVLKIAHKKDQPFCIILLDSDQSLSREYLRYLQGDYDYITKKAVLNVIDIKSKESEWYMKWLTPVSLPLTCVFSSDGRLIDLIPGAAKRAFYILKKQSKHRK